MVGRFLPSNSENPEHLRHLPVLPTARGTCHDTPARWYRIQVDYVQSLIALCDYYVHADAHEGNGDEAEEAAANWRELQIYLMSGTMFGEGGDVVSDPNFCEQVLLCLEEGTLDEGLQQFILQQNFYDNSTTIYPTYPTVDKEIAENCDPDAVYGMVTQMIDFMHLAITDFFHVLVASVNFTQKLAVMIGEIPIVGSITVEDIAEFVAFITEDCQENYDASYTEQFAQETKCEVFCMVMDDCTLTMGDMMDMFWAHFQQDVRAMSFYDAMEFLANGTWGGTEWANVMFAFLTYCLNAGSEWMGLNPEFYNQMMKSFWNDPNGDWAVLCDDCVCGDWQQRFSFGLDDYDFVPWDISNVEGKQYVGEHLPGLYWSETEVTYGNGNVSNQGAIITRHWSSRVINRVVLRYTAAQGVFEQGIVYPARIILQENLVTVFDTYPGEVGQWVEDGELRVDTYGVTADRIIIGGICANKIAPPAASGGTTRIHSVQLCGDGTNPFE